MMRSLAFAAAIGLSALLPSATAVAQEFTGAGSTFVYPLLQRWSKEYVRSQWTTESQPVGGLDYEPIGSQAGVMRLKERAVDFGATEVPLSSDEIKRYEVGQFPVVIGGIVAAVNLDGVRSGQLKLTGELLAEVYRGKVTNWSDPAIKALNPDITLPSAPIIAVRRADGSGTTFTFTSYLSKVSLAWKSEVGAALSVAWPVGEKAKGNEGVAEAVQRTRNAIGYVEFASARKAGLSFAQLRNQAGRFVTPSPEGFQAAAASADWKNARDFDVQLTDAPGEAAYPLVATTFVAMPRGTANAGHGRAVLAFFQWSLQNGTAAASELGYVPLPQPLIEQVLTYCSTQFAAKR
jgi:phosphate transport system substrate-binding protein